MQIINKGLKKGYVIHQTTTGIYSVCRILNEYDNMNDAIDGISSLLARQTTEKKLLKEYTKKENL